MSRCEKDIAIQALTKALEPYGEDILQDGLAAFEKNFRVHAPRMAAWLVAFDFGVLEEYRWED